MMLVAFLSVTYIFMNVESKKYNSRGNTNTLCYDRLDKQKIELIQNHINTV